MQAVGSVFAICVGSESATPCLTRNMVAVLRAMLKLRITSSLPQLLVLVDGLRWIMQNSFNERYAKELAICRPHFDRGLAKHHELITSSGRTTKEWWTLIRNVAQLAFDSKEFEICVNHQGAWTTIREDRPCVVSVFVPVWRLNLVGVVALVLHEFAIDCCSFRL